jgi:subfamily B ATP-binding cassette protein MsbA
MSVVKQPRLYGRLLQSVKPYTLVFCLGLVGTVLLSVCDAGLTFLIKPIIDKGSAIGHSASALAWIPIGMVLIVLIRAVSGFSSNYCLGYVGKTIVRDFRLKVFSKILNLPVTYFDVHGSAEMISTIIYNIDQLEQAASQSLIIFFREGMLAVSMLFLMFQASWQITLSFLLISPFVYFAIIYFSRAMRKLSRVVQETMKDVTHVVEEGVLANREVRIYQGYSYEVGRMHKATNANRNRLLSIVANNSVYSSLIQIMLTLPVALLLFLTIHSYFHLTIGSLALLITAMLQLPRPARRLTNLNSDIQRGLAATESVFELLDEQVESTGSLTIASRSRGDLRFEHVNFKYSTSNRLILKDINFHIPPGGSMALVGASGSGKSSCVNLIPRFYELSSGAILLDGQDIKTLDVNSLRSQISYVSQNTVLFNNTIFNNIAYALPEVNFEEVIMAAKRAAIYEFIMSLPEGFDTLVGDNGILLSGGQRQRVAIARAILKDSPILILDEATSALDTVSEKAIQTALNSLVRNKTTIMVAHRLSTIVDVDTIVVFENGSIVESGSHTELMSLGGNYYNLYQMQQAEVMHETIC